MPRILPWRENASLRGRAGKGLGNRNDDGGTPWKARGIGPIGPRPTSLENFQERIDECRASYSFEDMSFYARTAEYIHVTSVTIQYMNGKTVTLSGEGLKKRLSYQSGD